MNDFQYTHHTILAVANYFHGSGIDCRWNIFIVPGGWECLNSYHVMNNDGMYVGYIDFAVCVSRQGEVDVFINKEEADNLAFFNKDEDGESTIFVDDLDDIIFEGWKNAERIIQNQMEMKIKTEGCELIFDLGLALDHVPGEGLDIRKLDNIQSLQRGNVSIFMMGDGLTLNEKWQYYYTVGYHGYR